MTLKHVIVSEIWMFASPRPVTSQNELNDGKHSARRFVKENKSDGRKPVNASVNNKHVAFRFRGSKHVRCY